MRERALKRIVLGVLLLVSVGCGRNRFDYIDIAASEKALAALEAGFEAVPDSVSGGKTDFFRTPFDQTHQRFVVCFPETHLRRAKLREGAFRLPARGNVKIVRVHRGMRT